jgi:hypothetical protein
MPAKGHVAYQLWRSSWDGRRSWNGFHLTKGFFELGIWGTTDQPRAKYDDATLKI